MDLPPRRELKKLIARVAELEGLDGSIGVIFVDDSYMTGLNRKFRNKDGTTDVLTFSLRDEFQKERLGEIYVSVDKAREQAKEYADTVEGEIKRLVIHGLLHLAGYTHSQMKTKQEKYLNL